MTTENKFPTIRDLRDRLSELVDQGLGEQPVQILVVPDSTMQSIARATEGSSYDHTKPALMIDLIAADESGRLPVALISTERLEGRSPQTPLTNQ